MDKERKAVEALLRGLELDAAIRQAEAEEFITKLHPLSLELALKEVKETGRIVTRAGRVDGRRAAGKRRAKQNAKRRNKKARQQRWKRKWKLESLEQAVEGNYYEYISRRWKKKGRKWAIGREEWDLYVQPCTPNKATVELRRYDTSLPTTLDNIVVYNVDGGAVLFDGKEHAMRIAGYML